MRYGRTCELALLRWNGRDAAGEAWEQATGRSLPRPVRPPLPPLPGAASVPLPTRIPAAGFTVEAARRLAPSGDLGAVTS